MNKNNILFFTLGSIFGGAVFGIIGYNVGKKKAEDRCDEEIERMRNYFEDNKENKIADKKKSEVSEDIKEKLLKNWDKPNLKSVEDELAENEFPTEDEDEVEADKMSEMINDEYNENKYRKSEIISEDEIGELSPGWDSEEFIYYSKSGKFVNEDMNAIEDYHGLFGDLIDFWVEDDENTEDLIVKSYEYMTIFRLMKYNNEVNDEAENIIYKEGY